MAALDEKTRPSPSMTDRLRLRLPSPARVRKLTESCVCAVMRPRAQSAVPGAGAVSFMVAGGTAMHEPPHSMRSPRPHGGCQLDGRGSGYGSEMRGTVLPPPPPPPPPPVLVSGASPTPVSSVDSVTTCAPSAGPSWSLMRVISGSLYAKPGPAAGGVALAARSGDHCPAL